MVDVFRALADPTRRAIIDELTERDGQTLFEICSRLTVKHGLDSSRQAVRKPPPDRDHGVGAVGRFPQGDDGLEISPAVADLTA